MPRRNHNARPIYRPKASGPEGLMARRESWISLLPYDGRIALRDNSSRLKAQGSKPNIFDIRPPMIEMPGCKICKSSKLKVTREAIVRSHREECRLRSDQIPLPPPLLKGDKKGITSRFINAINWNVAFEWACWAVTIGCLIYLCFTVFIPFGLKLLWE